jgi:three-Cys-motif partner protein
MTANAFGGRWTSEKLDILAEYLNFYTTALKNQPFDLVYIDTFAGTGRCRIREGGGDKVINGSARIALDTPGFSHYRFVEPNPRHRAELEQLVAQHPNVHHVSISDRRAADVLPSMLADYDWRKTRGVLFLDPYGLQCNWQMLQQVNATRALDVFFLVSLSGLFRQAAIDANHIDEGKAAILTNFLGTDAWRSALYTREQSDFFDGPQLTRQAGWRAILDFTTARLLDLFPYVAQPRLLGAPAGPPLFALYFAVTNPNPAAIRLARKVSGDILKKLR